jgi:hypothetical protein
MLMRAVGGKNMEVSTYASKKWKIWKFALGGTVFGAISFRLNLNSEVEIFRSMHFNNAEILLQIFGYVFSGAIYGMLIAAIHNIWTWHSAGNRGLGKPHAVLLAVITSFAVLTLATLDPYALV